MNDHQASRRAALRWLATAAGGVALGAVPACAGGGRAAPEAVSRVPLARLPDGGRLKIDHHGEPVELTRAGARIVARSLICTHQYCRLFWHPGSNAYRCPCHGGQFSPDGRPLAGPVSIPMWTLPVRVQGDTIVIGGIA